MPIISPLHSDEGRKLLDLVDKLRVLGSISHEIALPQIVVIGQQSSGKSSVLRAISKIPFPINAGLCTQFATEIISRRSPMASTRATIVPHEAVGDGRRARIDEFSTTWSQIRSEEDISNVIENAKEVMELNEHKKICKDRLRLEFCGPDQDHLSLIDLPGLFQQAMPGQRGDDRELVDELVGEYIAGEQTIILAVVSGQSDLQNQRVFDMFHPFQERTLGIITAPDTVEAGTPHATNIWKLASNTQFKAGYGWHLLRNLSHGEATNGLDRDAVEHKFFAEQAPWNQIEKARAGIGNLKIKLADLLRGRISKQLPDMQKKVQKVIEECEKELEKLGEERSTLQQQREYLTSKSTKFKMEIEDTLNGTSKPSDWRRVRPSLRSVIRDTNEQFASKMLSMGHSWRLVADTEDPSAMLPPEAIFSSDDLAPQGVGKRQLLEYMRNEVSRSRGRELLGTFDPIWVGEFFHRQSRKWEKLALEHADTTFQLVKQCLWKVTEKIAAGEGAERLLLHAIDPALELRRETLRVRVFELLSPYTSNLLRAAPGVHRLIVEALLNHLLPEERADTYRHKEIRSTDRLTYPVRFSWSCLAGSHPAEVYEPTSRNRNAAYSQHSHSA